jgi:hypothetical protein
MKGFRVVCCQCGSENVMEKSSSEVLELADGEIKHGEGIRRMCNDCGNESFIIVKTWPQKNES